MLAVHNPLGPVSTAACLHPNLSCSNFGVPVQLEWEDGHLLPRRHPGLGVEFDRDLQKALARKRHVAARHVLGPLVVQKARGSVPWAQAPSTGPPAGRLGRWGSGRRHSPSLAPQERAPGR